MAEALHVICGSGFVMSSQQFMVHLILKRRVLQAKDACGILPPYAEVVCVLSFNYILLICMLMI